MRIRQAWLALALALMTGIAGARAAGFEQGAPTASGAGLAGNAMLSLYDASILHWNPAGLAWMDGTSFTAGMGTWYRNASVRLPSGVAPNRTVDVTNGHVFIGWKPHDSDWGAGFGFRPDFQVRNDWSSVFPGQADVFDLTVDHASLDVVRMMRSGLAVGAGLDGWIGKVSLQQGASTLNGRALAGGGHVSMLWKPAPFWRVGVFARSGARLSFTQGANRLKVRLPDTVRLAAARDVADVWRLEFDLGWTRWSALKDLNVTGVQPQSHPLALRDSLRAGLGLTWTWRPDAQFRFGYAFDQGANKTAGFNPILADQDAHVLAIGAGGRLFGVHLDVAWSYAYQPRK
ncbi:MAG: outer membrane protein transport protein, partial [Mariprofundaceae bacterium]